MEATQKTKRTTGRPKEYDDRKSFTLSLRPGLVGWLDQIAKESGVSRNRMIELQLQMMSMLSSSGHIVFNDEEPSSISFRPIANRDVFRDQLKSGLALELLDSMPTLNTFTVVRRTVSELDVCSDTECEDMQCDSHEA